ncbi:MAG TPA: ATP-binding protein, partial [Methylomirabilota bacterium]|nr:ATP-binding protein [Methylomirabilota bacterium]
VARRVGGPRVLALPIIRAMAVVAGCVWVALSPRAHAGLDAADATMLAFLLYSAALMALLWVWPGATLRLNFLVLLVDLAFALLLIHLTGGAQSTLYLALLLIAGLQSYYYGIRRGVGVAAASSLAYTAVVWPTLSATEAADLAIRLAVLIGTSIGLGLLADVEEAERIKVLELSSQAHDREQFIRSVVDGLHEGVLALDATGRIVAWNRALEQRYGIKAAEVVGQDLFESLPVALREAWSESVHRLLRGEIDGFTLEHVAHETRNKGHVVQNLKGGLLRQHGRPAGAVILVEDITERVALERAARQSEKLAGLGTLAAGLAHELNNPIGIISSRIELMLLEAAPGTLSDSMREDLTVLHRHAQRVARIVQGLLSFARLAPGDRAAVNLNRIVDDTLLLLEKQVTRDGIRVTRSLAAALPLIHGDPTALQQVLMNLVVNARAAMPDGGEITVATEPAPGRPDQVRLIVRDTGAGIPAEILPKIFDPFFTTKPSGTGLGLSISYGIVRDHEGTVDVDSRPGQGTTFVLTFPVHPVEAAT